MIARLWPLLIGFSIWALAFVALYAVQALGCVWGWPEGQHRGVLLVIWVTTLAILALVLWYQCRRPFTGEPMLVQAGIMLTALAVAATVIIYLPTTFVSLCV